MTTTAKKLYIRRKLLELIRYTESCGLEMGEIIVVNMEYSLSLLDRSTESARALKLAK